MNRIVIRPRIQIPVLLVVFGTFGLLGVTFFTEGDVVAKRQWFPIILGAVCIVGGLVGIWRSLRLGVVIDSEGVRVRNLDSRDDFTPWREVKGIECLQIDVRAGMPLYGPVIVIGDGSQAIPIRTLGSYSQQDAEKAVERLRSLQTAVDPENV